jgi:type I restriction-modification system DNA methylase subunit
MGRQKKKVADTPNGNGGSIKDLLDELWEAAVKLRGSIEPADYKRYVLPIIFLRFLSLRYDRRRAELEKLIADPKSDYHTTDRKHAEAILNDPDEKLYTVLIPPSALWAASTVWLANLRLKSPATLTYSAAWRW